MEKHHNHYIKLDNDEIVVRNVARWEELQCLIKEEITINDIINKQVRENLDGLKKNYHEYYSNKLIIKSTCDFSFKMIGVTNNVSLQRVEISDNVEKELLECTDPATKFLFTIRNNIQHVLNIIDLVKKEDYDALVDLFGHFFYENILIQNPEQEEILTLCFLLLEKEVGSLSTPSVASFLDTSFIGKLLKNLSRRQDFKAYLSMIIGELILNMENSTDNFLEIDIGRINDHIKNKKMTEIINKSFNLEKTKELFDLDKKQFLVDRVRKTTITKKHMNKANTGGEIVKNEEEVILTRPRNVSTISLHAGPQSYGDFLINFEEYTEIDSKISEINSDYLIDLTEEELMRRFEKESEPEMKEFCI
jgi:hypothetical protein